MTPEQVELLTRKAHKMDLRGADMVTIAIGSALGGKRPTQLLDEIESTETEDQPLSKKALRVKKYGKWLEKGWDDAKLIEFLKERGYDPLRYYEPEELIRINNRKD
jgi:hypothetical protein